MEMKIRKIMVPTDFSEYSGAALNYAIFLARAFGAEVAVLHVLEPAIYGLDFSITHPEGSSDLKEELMKGIGEWVEKMRGLGISAEGHLVTGNPFVEVLKVAKNVKADLIVMGTHGRTGLAHVFMGSVAERVVEKAHCPVLTVKASERPAAPPVKETPKEAEGQAFCHLCGQPSQEFVCETCKIRVQAEALEQKRKVEKEGGVQSRR